jgi:hypothetical protein
LGQASNPTTQMADSSGNVLAYANGGQPGTPDAYYAIGTTNPNPNQCYGTATTTGSISLPGGAGGAANPSAPINRAGNPGTVGGSCYVACTESCNTCDINQTCCSCDFGFAAGANGAPGTAPAGLINSPSGTDTSLGPGYVLLIW